MTSRDDSTGLETLLAALRDGDVLARIDAAEALGRLHVSRAVEPLIAALGDAEPQVVRAAVESLGLLGDPRAAQPIAKVLEGDAAGGLSAHIAMANAVADALKRLGEPGFQALQQLLYDHAGTEFIGVSAVSALGEIGDPRAIETLFHALHSPIWEVVEAAANALYGFGDSTLPLFLAALMFPDGDTRWHASRMLPKFGSVTVAALLDLLRSSPHAYVRAEAADTLAAFDDERVQPALRAALADPAAQVRDAAAFSLADLGDDSVIDHLLDMPSNQDRHGRSSAIVADLSDFGPPVLLPMLRALQNRERPACARYRAAYVLGELEDPRAVVPLISALRDPDASVRTTAASVLGSLGDVRAVEPLVELLGDESSQVRGAAINALGALGNPRAGAALAQFAHDASQEREVRRAAIFALSNCGDRIAELREAALGDDRGIAYEALSVLSRSGSAGVVVLLELASSASPAVRSGAYTWLEHAVRWDRDGSHGDEPRILDFLAAALDTEPDTRLRQQVALIVGRLGDARAVPALLDGLRSKSIFTRVESANLLANLGDESAIPFLMGAYEAGLNTGAEHQQLAPFVGPDARNDFLAAIRRIQARARASPEPLAGD